MFALRGSIAVVRRSSVHELRRLNAYGHRMESGCGDCCASETPAVPVAVLEFEGEDDWTRLCIHILHHFPLLILLFLLRFHSYPSSAPASSSASPTLLSPPSSSSLLLLLPSCLLLVLGPALQKRILARMSYRITNR